MDAGIAVLGVSAGGLDALCVILSALPPTLAFGVVIVQHRSKDSTALCEVLQDCTHLAVHDVTDKEPIEAGGIYLAPADYHLLVEPGHFALSLDEPEAYSRPSIDLALETAADSYGPAAVGVVLTGANSDGARGLRRIVDLGGRAIVQDPATAEVPTMPRAALEAVPESELLTLPKIAARLGQLGARTRTEAGR
jgi:two-component system chemotaxis response regulator CheB